MRMIWRLAKMLFFVLGVAIELTQGPIRLGAPPADGHDAAHVAATDPATALAEVARRLNGEPPSTPRSGPRLPVTTMGGARIMDLR
jgi:hypothetical protein